MIDIHSHILPGVDDGPGTLEEAAAMVQMAARTGTTDMVASPHANAKFLYTPEAVAAKCRELDKAAGHVIHIRPGCQLALIGSVLDDALECPSRYTIDGAGYLLVELSARVIPAGIERILTRFQDIGVTPIITHPERNDALRRQRAHLERWVDSGCLVQVTAQSLTGSFGKPAQCAAEELIERGWVHAVASDAHDLKYRPPLLSDAYWTVSRRYGDEAARVLFIDNPAAVIAGAPVMCLKPARRRRFCLWPGA
jgi:protein-tyrosine phosphatase